ncbi:hypothetical protein B005_3692 [Nocardiopsis alba ATCC BAA-2165]|uniref:Uncharacterized protein n=1 Tax=Nocardiopsis alba (strain ATCC BAA-2165 / BE74) TaxID=1205910 RepID=J7L8H9_NOCAA|nr:hypothetical protein B005_3692 [Nocardiopsis alba ATCC BAA-2165]
MGRSGKTKGRGRMTAALRRARSSAAEVARALGDDLSLRPMDTVS